MIRVFVRPTAVPRSGARSTAARVRQPVHPNDPSRVIAACLGGAQSRLYTPCLGSTEVADQVLVNRGWCAQLISGALTLRQDSIQPILALYCR